MWSLMATLLSENVCYCPETRIKTNKSRGTHWNWGSGKHKIHWGAAYWFTHYTSNGSDPKIRFCTKIDIVQCPSLDSFPFQFAQQVPLITILVHFSECDNCSKFLASFGRDLSFALRACNHWRGCFAHWLPNLFSRDPESRFYSNRNRNRCPMQFKQQKSKPGPNSLDFVRLKIGGVQIPLPTSNWFKTFCKMKRQL